MQKSTPFKISIITCFYNVENFIEETIKSVLKQQYAHWELLLIDDGSADGSTAIAKKYAQKFPQKFFYHELKAIEIKALAIASIRLLKKQMENLFHSLMLMMYGCQTIFHTRLR